jgi:glutamate racemase
MIQQPRGDEMDVMVLACTHFPLLADEIAAAFPNIAQVDGGPGIARRIAHLTQGQPWPASLPGGIAIFTAAHRAPLASSLARFGLDEVREL